MPKTILITGAGSDFGRAAAEILSDAGHTVFASMRDPSGRNRERANALWAQSIQVLPIDVTNDESVGRGIQDVLAKAGKIDVLVNNASLTPVGASEAFTCDQMQAALDTNVTGLFRMVRAVLPTMRLAQNGLIVNVGSVLGRISLPNFGLLCASKSAGESLGDALRFEIATFGIDMVSLQASLDLGIMLDRADYPNDGARLKSYRKRGKAQAVAKYAARHEQTVATSADMAQALLNLVMMPAGCRPQHLPVNPCYGVDELNRQSILAQQIALRELGLAHADSPS